MSNKVGCKVYVDGKWRRGTLEWLTPTEENSSLTESPAELGAIRKEVPTQEDPATPIDAVLDLASDARLKAAAFYERWAFWIMVGGSVVGGGWISSYFKMALWHVGQFLVKLN